MASGSLTTGHDGLDCCDSGSDRVMRHRGIGDRVMRHRVMCPVGGALFGLCQPAKNTTLRIVYINTNHHS